ncbi:hypothetical protein VTI74DRAFT_1102 [Chaetomium olivicolor]
MHHIFMGLGLAPVDQDRHCAAEEPIVFLHLRPQPSVIRRGVADTTEFHVLKRLEVQWQMQILVPERIGLPMPKEGRKLPQPGPAAHPAYSSAPENDDCLTDNKAAANGVCLSGNRGVSADNLAPVVDPVLDNGVPRCTGSSNREELEFKNPSANLSALPSIVVVPFLTCVTPDKVRVKETPTIHIRSIFVYGQTSSLARSLQHPVNPHDPGERNTISVQLVERLSRHDKRTIEKLATSGKCFIGLEWTLPGQNFPVFTTRHLLVQAPGDVGFSGGLDHLERISKDSELTTTVFDPDMDENSEEDDIPPKQPLSDVILPEQMFCIGFSMGARKQWREADGLYSGTGDTSGISDLIAATFLSLKMVKQSLGEGKPAERE